MPEENLPMVAVRFRAYQVVNPQTNLPLLEARGAVGYIVVDGTTLAQAQAGVGLMHLSQDEAGNIPLAQPITITPGGYIPAHYNQDGLEEALFLPLSGTWSTPVESAQGLRDAARAAAADATVARQAAQEAALAAKAPTDDTMATLLRSEGSSARTAAMELIAEAPSGPGGVTSFLDLEDVPTAFPTTADKVQETPTAKVFTDTERKKLSAITEGATKNRADTETDKLLATRVTVVEHSANPDVVRPDVKAVQWVGTVRPNNMTAADTWIGPEGATPASSPASQVVIKATAMNTWPTAAQIDAQILAEGGPNFAGLLVFDSTPFPGCSAPPLRTGAHWLERTAA